MEKESHKRQLYNVKISYKDETKSVANQHYNSLISSDSVYLFFENGFDNHSISIFQNLHLHKEQNISTAYIGLAEVFVLGKHEMINSVSIQLENGPLAFIDIRRSNHNIWNVNFLDNTLRISALNNAPFYD